MWNIKKINKTKKYGINEQTKQKQTHRYREQSSHYPGGGVMGGQNG